MCKVQFVCADTLKCMCQLYEHHHREENGLDLFFFFTIIHCVNQWMFIIDFFFLSVVLVLAKSL